jgi:hypothetical protein
VDQRAESAGDSDSDRQRAFPRARGHSGQQFDRSHCGRNTWREHSVLPSGGGSCRHGRFSPSGAIARENWEQTYVGPVRTGEIIHVYAIGFGPVSPELPYGFPAPSAEPLARITQPLTCSNAEILYAGLAPGTIERVYQIDLRIGPTHGYQQFTCKLGNSEPFIFLTLNVIP